jgi:predicted flap endonuclease-1-like 5' DNA nuclease
MTDRNTYRQRVATVRGRARAQLAALRKERLARMRPGAEVPDDTFAAAWLADGVADRHWDRAPMANDGAARGGEPPALRLVEEAPEPASGGGDVGPVEPLMAADEATPEGVPAAEGDGNAPMDGPAPDDAPVVAGDAGPEEPEMAVGEAAPEGVLASVADAAPGGAPHSGGDAPVVAGDGQSAALAEEPPVEDMHVEPAPRGEEVSDLGPLMLDSAMASAPDAAAVPSGEDEAEASAVPLETPADVPAFASDRLAPEADVPVTADDGATAVPADGPAPAPSAITTPPPRDAEDIAAGNVATAPDAPGSPAPAEHADADMADPASVGGPGPNPPADAAQTAAPGGPEPAEPVADAPVEMATDPMADVPADLSAEESPYPVAAPDVRESARPLVDGESDRRQAAGDGREEAAILHPPAPEEAGSLPAGDLSDIPGVGPGLVWMLQSAGVRSLDDLARVEEQDLSARLGSISKLLDLHYLIDFARNRTAN